MNSLVIMINIFRRLFKEINAFIFLLLFPVMAGVLAVVMFSNNAVSIAVSNVPENDFGIIKYFEDSNYIVKITDNFNLENMVIEKQVDIGIIFTENFTQDNLKVKLISLKDDEKVHSLSAMIEGYISALNTGTSPKEVLKIQKINNEIQQPKLAIGMLSMFIILFIGTGMGLLLEDKKRKTFMRTFCTPLKEYEPVLGHLAASFIMGMIQIGIFLTVTTLVLKISWGTSVLNVFLILLIYLITAIGLAIGIAGLVGDQQKYNIILMLIAVSTSFMGGSFFPLELLNDFINKAANFIPQKWLIDAFVKLAQGYKMADIYMNLAILALFGIVMFTFGIKVLKPTNEDI